MGFFFDGTPGESDFKAHAASIAMIVIIIAAAVLAWISVYVIEPGQIGVKVNTVSGATQSVEPGWHFKRPVLDAVYKYSVRTQLAEYKAVGASRDLQEVTLDVQINFRPVYEAVNKIHVSIGPAYIERVINPAVYESAKAAIAQFNAEEMMVERERLRAIIEEKLKGNLAAYFIFIETVNIKDIDFRDEFNKSVEAKVIEQQKVKTAEYRALQAEQEKKAAILLAEGEAERQRLLTRSASKDSIALAWIAKWQGTTPQVIAGSNSNFLLNIGDLLK